jgi:zinc finger HIT domain-containing protein 3
LNKIGFSCSLNCFKAHKESDKCVEKAPQTEDIIEDRQPSRTNVFTTMDTVPTDKLDLLSQSEPIKNLLKNPNLRNFLTEVDSASIPWNAMKLAMMEPIFTEFADECMKIIEPNDEEEKC